MILQNIFRGLSEKGVQLPIWLNTQIVTKAANIESQQKTNNTDQFVSFSRKTFAAGDLVKISKVPDVHNLSSSDAELINKVYKNQHTGKLQSKTGTAWTVSFPVGLLSIPESYLRNLSSKKSLYKHSYLQQIPKSVNTINQTNSIVDKVAAQHMAHELSKHATKNGMFGNQLRYLKSYRDKTDSNIVRADFVIDYIDNNDLRQTVTASIGFHPGTGRFILPRTFATTKNSMVPFTKEAVQALSLGKTFDPVEVDIPRYTNTNPHVPTIMRDLDPMRFKVLGEREKKLIRRAFEPGDTVIESLAPGEQPVEVKEVLDSGYKVTDPMTGEELFMANDYIEQQDVVKVKTSKVAGENWDKEYVKDQLHTEEPNKRDLNTNIPRRNSDEVEVGLQEFPDYTKRVDESNDPSKEDRMERWERPEYPPWESIDKDKIQNQKFPKKATEDLNVDTLNLKDKPDSELRTILIDMVKYRVAPVPFEIEQIYRMRRDDIIKAIKEVMKAAQPTAYSFIMDRLHKKAEGEEETLPPELSRPPKQRTKPPRGLEVPYPVKEFSPEIQTLIENVDQIQSTLNTFTAETQKMQMEVMEKVQAMRKEKNIPNLEQDLLNKWSIIAKNVRSSEDKFLRYKDQIYGILEKIERSQSVKVTDFKERLKEEYPDAASRIEELYQKMRSLKNRVEFFVTPIPKQPKPRKKMQSVFAQLEDMELVTNQLLEVTESLSDTVNAITSLLSEGFQIEDWMEEAETEELALAASIA